MMEKNDIDTLKAQMLRTLADAISETARARSKERLAQVVATVLAMLSTKATELDVSASTPQIRPCCKLYTEQTRKKAINYLFNGV